MSLRGWEKLTCECGSQEFISTHQLTWHEANGTAFKQTGWKCAKCNRVVSTANLINVCKRKQVDAKIHELEAERA